MLARIKKAATCIAMAATVAAILAMWASAYSAHIPPQGFGWYDVLGMAFPVFAAASAVSLVLWLAFKPRLALVPFFGLLFCISDLRAYCPVNIPQNPPAGSLKVMSYNAQNFDGTANEDSEEKKQIISNIVNSNADIVCIQEGDYWADWDKLEKKLHNIYRYMDVLGKDSAPTTMRCFSKLRIIKAEQLAFPGSFNSTVAFYLQHTGGDTIIIVSNHLQSDNLTPEELDNYSALVKGKKEAGGKNPATALLSVLRKVAGAAEKRGSQVDSVAAFISAHKDTPMILCGDFNDTPISYSRREIARRLTDAYAATGLGPGFTYTSNGMHVRIDHMMCSRHWKPYAAKVNSHAKGSDHYPITAFFKLKAK